ncbi:MAG: DUF4783 domain-containing protein [Bacteroidales bacterium]
MKRLLQSLLLTILSIGSVWAQVIPQNITEGFRDGNASKLAPNLADRVNLILPQGASETDKAKAQKDLSVFFSNTRPSDFQFMHKSEKGDSGFSIGKLATSKGDYRVHLLFRTQNNKILIHQIRIDKFNE